MTVFKLKVDRKEKGIRMSEDGEGELDLNMHLDVLVGKDEDSLNYAGSMVLWKDELKELISRIDKGQYEDVMTEDTPKEISLEIGVV